MITLGIETSCDETALCLLETKEKSKKSETDKIIEYRILGDIVHSQINIHKEYGGVFPILAKREHIKNLPILFNKIIHDSKIEIKDIDAIAVTYGPGLEPALWTGIVFAKEIGEKYNIPVFPINHMEGHIVSTFIKYSDRNKDFEQLKPLLFPSLALLISGGHTELIKVDGIGSYEVIGKTRDDAIGEAFDKTARMLGLPYPGGPEISKLAEQARRENIPRTIILPRPMIHSKDLNFSFSGLKTSILYLLQKIDAPTEKQKKEICREFEDAVTEVILDKTRRALEQDNFKKLIIGGGVIANMNIRNKFSILAKSYNIPLYIPDIKLTGDNAIMIALAHSLHKIYEIECKKIEMKAIGNLSL